MGITTYILSTVFLTIGIIFAILLQFKLSLLCIIIICLIFICARLKDIYEEIYDNYNKKDSN